MLAKWYNVFFQSLTICFLPQEHIFSMILQSFENVAVPAEHCDAVVTRLCGRDPSLDQALEILTQYINNILF